MQNFSTTGKDTYSNSSIRVKMLITINVVYTTPSNVEVLLLSLSGHAQRMLTFFGLNCSVIVAQLVGLDKNELDPTEVVTGQRSNVPACSNAN